MKPADQLECPNCQTSGTHNIPKSIHVSLSPLEKARILDGSFFEWTCPSCGNRFFVDDVFLYCDDMQSYYLYLVPGYDQSTMSIPSAFQSQCDAKNGTLRVTSGYIDFIEKIRIFDAGLDDRIVEAMKAIYASVYHQTEDETVYNMIFEEVSPEGDLCFAVFLKDDDFSIDVPADAYTQTAEDFSQLFTDENKNAFLMIDQNWLAQSLQSDDLPC